MVHVRYVSPVRKKLLQDSKITACVRVLARKRDSRRLDVLDEIYGKVHAKFRNLKRQSEVVVGMMLRKR